jgi:arginine N-succinyltransferase
VGRRFFDMDYPQVERLTGGRSKAFIAELMPQSPIYVPLLPEAAQWAIGQLHPVSELPFSILLDEGFDSETYVDIFDGGPIVDARVALLKTVARSRHRAWTPASAAAAAEAATDLPWHLVAAPRRAGFAAVLRRAPAGPGALALDATTAARLGLAGGERLRTALLDADAQAATHAPAGAAAATRPGE